MQPGEGLGLAWFRGGIQGDNRRRASIRTHGKCQQRYHNACAGRLVGTHRTCASTFAGIASKETGAGKVDHRARGCGRCNQVPADIPSFKFYHGACIPRGSRPGTDAAARPPFNARTSALARQKKHHAIPLAVGSQPRESQSGRRECRRRATA